MQGRVMDAPRPTSELAAAECVPDPFEILRWACDYYVRPTEARAALDALVARVTDLETHAAGPTPTRERIREYHSRLSAEWQGWDAVRQDHFAYHQGAEACYICTLLAMVTDLEAQNATLLDNIRAEAVQTILAKEYGSAQFHRAEAAEAQVAALRGQTEDPSSVAQIAHAAISEVERLRDLGQIMLSRTSLLMLARGYLQMEAQVAALTTRPEWVTCDYQPEKREDDPGGSSCTQALAALSAQMAALTERLEEAKTERRAWEYKWREREQEVAALTQQVTDAEIRQVNAEAALADVTGRAEAAEAALAMTRQALAEISDYCDSCDEGGGLPSTIRLRGIARRALAATEEP